MRRSLGASEASRLPPIVIESASQQSKEHFLIPPHYDDSVETILISHGMIMDRVQKLAADIRNLYEGETIHLLCVLKGGSAFFQDLQVCLRNFHNFTKQDYIPFTFDFIRAKSYEGTESTGTVKVSGCDLDKLAGKNVLLVEDIIDTGTTMSMLVPLLEEYQPKSLRVASLLEKRTPKSCGYKADFVGFSVPDEFVIGYCLDYNDAFRDMNHICVISKVGIEKYKDGVPM
jgi:hypoxanthine phosphoribosyltransferase